MTCLIRRYELYFSLMIGLIFPAPISAQIPHMQFQSAPTPIDSSVVRLVSLPQDMSDFTAENLAHNLVKIQQTAKRRKKLSELLIQYDRDSNKILSRMEAWRAGFDIFRRIDANDDGRVTNDEIEEMPPASTNFYKYWGKSFEVFAKRQRCKLPQVPADAELVLTGVYDGEGLSPISIGDVATSTGVVELKIEEGSTKIYLILSSYESMVWKIEGHQDHLVNVVVSSRSGGSNGISASGVVGVEKRKVTILPRNCILNFDELKRNPNDWESKIYQRAFGQAHPKDDDAEEASFEVYQLIGREPDIVVANYSPTSISLPSGKMAKSDRLSDSPPPKGFSKSEWSMAIKHRPAGVAKLNKRKIVTPLAKKRLRVLPGYTGLSQLVANGTLRKAGTWADLYYLSRPLKVSPLEFDRIVIIVPKGLEKNARKFSDLCLVSQETKRVISTNSSCDSKIEYLRKFADF